MNASGAKDMFFEKKKKKEKKKSQGLMRLSTNLSIMARLPRALGGARMIRSMASASAQSRRRAVQLAIVWRNDTFHSSMAAMSVRVDVAAPSADATSSGTAGTAARIEPARTARQRRPIHRSAHRSRTLASSESQRPPCDDTVPQMIAASARSSGSGGRSTVDTP
jgi:hypothetical protein